jgi:hypothetical protein
MGEEMLMNFTASTGANPGEISCEFLPVEQDNHVILFARKVTEAGVRCDITRHDTGANPSSPYTITGLENGEQYHIYAVVTDAQYDAALTVSQSVAKPLQQQGDYSAFHTSLVGERVLQME